MTLFSMSLMGAVLIGAVWALRAVLRGRLPARTFVVLWMLAAARLALPMQVASPLSVYRLFTVTQGDLRADAAVSEPWAAVQQMPVPASAAEPAPVRLAAQADPWTAVWWTGFILCALIAVTAYVRWMRRFAVSLPVNAPAVQMFLMKHPLRRRLSVRSSTCIGMPLTYGVLRPVILLPSAADLTDEKQLTYVLTHEYIHIRHFDALLKFVLTAVCCVHWFNPFVWVMYVLAARDMELACDESVLAHCGGPADYARMLVRLEAQKLGYIMPGIGSAAGAARERIMNIMKFRKKSAVTLVVAGALVAGVGTVFAANAPAVRSDGPWAETIAQDAAAVEYAAGDAEYVEEQNEIEWWTAEEYAQWLEEEKAELQSILGSKSWTPSEGEFVWTQDRIDEAVAQYEKTLEEIRRGARVSKSVDGDSSVTMMQIPNAVEAAGAEADSIDPELLEDYAVFGLTMWADGPYYGNEKVRYFEDAVEIEPGAVVSKTTYFADDGTACVRTVRRPTLNADGSADPFGELLGIEPIPEDEAAGIIENLSGAELTVVVEDEAAAADLAPYEAFGLSYEDVSDDLYIFYKGKPVHSLYDPVTGTWFASSMHGYSLGPERIDLEAVYTGGRLSGLEIVTEQHGGADNQHTSAEGRNEQGRTFEDVFSAYESLGLSSRRVTTSHGGIGYNLYLDGNAVNSFSDIAPSGSAFTFESADQAADGFSVHVVYDGAAPVRIEKN